MKLFDEPFDLDKIEQALHDERFLSVAHFTIGCEENWRAGLDQSAKLIALFEEAGRDTTPIYAMASMLIRRTGQLRNPATLLAEATTKLGMLPPSAASYRSPSLDSSNQREGK